MGDKRKISTRETYILDEKDLEELDEATLTSVLRDISISIEGVDTDAEEKRESAKKPEPAKRGPDDPLSDNQNSHGDNLGYLIPDD